MKLEDFTRALENKYLNISTSSKILNEAINEFSSIDNNWILEKDPQTNFDILCYYLDKESGDGAYIYLPNEEYPSYAVEIVANGGYVQNESGKTFDNLDDAKAFCMDAIKNQPVEESKSLNESEEKWIPLNKIPVYGNVADGYECNQKAEVRNARTGRKYKAVSSNGGYFDLKYTVKLKNGKSTSIAKDKLDQEIKDSFVFSNLGETDTK